VVRSALEVRQGDQNPTRISALSVFSAVKSLPC
jgi:hypothetical protein